MHWHSNLHDSRLKAPERWGDDRPTVAVLCSTRFGIRNVVHSGLLTELVARGVRPWVLTSAAHAPGEGEQLLEGCQYATLQEAPAVASERGLSAQRALVRESFARRHRVSTQRIFERWRRNNGLRTPGWRSAAIEALAVLGAGDPCYAWQVAFLERRTRSILDLTAVREQLERIRPDLLISTACVAYGEYPYLLAAPELGISTLGCILSFDNLTSRGALPTFDHYAVWSDRMGQQVRRFYPDRRASTIHITGTPQFDFHVREEFRWSRSDTLRHLGLPAGSRYLLHAANHSEFTPTEPELIAELSRRIREIEELREHYIVVRPHPYDDRRRWAKVAGDDPKIVMSWPAGADEPPRAADQSRLVSTLLHADVCLNTASTMSLDASVVDTPVVCIGFGWSQLDGEDPACRELHFTDHYKPLVNSGGVRLVHTMDETLREITAYVVNPSRDAEARAALVATECGGLDGKAAARVADLVEELVRPARGEDR